jgi:hypothetical protein
MQPTLLTPSLKEPIAQLLATPLHQLTWGRRILWMLLKLNPNLVDHLQYHKKVNYWWITLHSSILGEIVLCFWLPQSWSERHDHYHSRNLTIVLMGKLIARLYHVSSSKFFTFHKAEVKELEIATTPAWQIHSLANPFDELCVSLNFYLFRRPSLFLAVED